MYTWQPSRGSWNRSPMTFRVLKTFTVAEIMYTYIMKTPQVYTAQIGRTNYMDIRNSVFTIQDNLIINMFIKVICSQYVFSTEAEKSSSNFDPDSGLLTWSWIPFWMIIFSLNSRSTSILNLWGWVKYYLLGKGWKEVYKISAHLCKRLVYTRRVKLANGLSYPNVIFVICDTSK